MTEYEKSRQEEIEEFAKELTAAAEKSNKKPLTAREAKQIRDFAASWLLLLGDKKE